MPILSRLHLRVAHVCALICALVFVCHSAVAQTGFASLSGRVADSSGAVIQKADVSLRNLDTGVVLQSQSNNDGIYNFPSVQPGNYVMRVQKQGFRSVDVTGLTVYTQDQLARNFSLEVGSASESITVSSSTTSDSPAVSMTVSRQFVEATPLNGRSLQDLIQLTPGTVSTQNGGAYSINGQRTDANNFTVDGVSANLGGINNNSSGSVSSGLSGSSPSQTALGTTQTLVSVDDLQEFTIQTSGYAAEYGRNPGGQAQFTTRSGTNEIHATAFDYLRNTAFDANSYSNNYYGYPKTAEHQNDFGGTVGGPLAIPRLYNGKDKTFYFFSYEGLRLLLPSSETEYVPTQAFISAVSPNVQRFLSATPLPNTTLAGDECTVTGTTINLSGGSGQACDEQFYYGYSYPNNIDNISLRLDHALGKRLHLFVRYANTPSSAVYGAEVQTTTAINAHTWTAGLTANISNNVLNEFRFNFSHDNEQLAYGLRAIGGSSPWNPNLLIPAAYYGPFAYAYESMSLSGTALSSVFTEIGGSYTGQHQYQVIDSLAWTHGAHALKFGADWRRLTPIFIGYPYSSTASFTSVSALQQGYASSVSIGASAPGQPVFDNLSLYAQDHWKVVPKLSVDFGLRWEFDPPPGPSNGHYPVTLSSTNLATTQIAPSGEPVYQSNYHSFAPRVGFAWSVLPSQSHALTLRGGFGIFFDTAQSAASQAYAGNYPFSANRATQTNVSLPLSDAALAPPSLTAPLTPPYTLAYTLSPDLTKPYTEQWNFSLDESLNARNTLTLSYVGNNGRKLLFTEFYRSVVGNANFTNLYFTNNGAASSYNALQIQDIGKIAKGLDVVSSFTWGHALDDASSDLSSIVVPVWGNSNYDLRRVLNVAANYLVPSSSHNYFLHAVSDGWTFSNRFSTQSGYPITTFYQGQVVLPDGNEEHYYPNVVPGVPIYLHGTAANIGGMAVPHNWRLNPAAFSCVPTTGTKPCVGTPTQNGDLGRNYVRNPAFYTLNSSMQRSFPIAEQLHLNFRIDAFNVLNHPNLYNPVTTLSSSSFGALVNGTVNTIGSKNALYGMGAARSLQLSLHLQF